MKPDDPIFALALLIPGFVILSVRTRFVTGRLPVRPDTALTYLLFSVLYYVLFYPMIDTALTMNMNVGDFYGWDHKVLALAVVTLLCPALFGLILGLLSRYEVIDHIFRSLRLNIVGERTSAWDWKFSQFPNCWVEVHLKNGSRIGGKFLWESLASSDPKERDIYIDPVFDIMPDESWQERRGSSVLIKSDEIRLIEFFDPERDDPDQGENGDD